MMREGFERSFLRDARSLVFREYCRRVHGVDRFQYNSLTNEHFEHLLRGLALTEGGSFLDVGCAVGTMTIEVARRTKARGTGIDFAPALLQRARLGKPSDVEVSFCVGDLDDLQPRASSADAILAIDALYFASDLPYTVSVLLVW